MKHETMDEIQTVARITELLAAHASLIGETSEEFAQNVIAQVHTIQSLLAENDAVDKAKIEALLHKIMTGMQVQDILRQQVHVIFAGLEVLSEAHVPNLLDQESWIAAGLKEIERSYVMQSQAILHAQILGLEIPPEDHNDDILF